MTQSPVIECLLLLEIGIATKVLKKARGRVQPAVHQPNKASPLTAPARFCFNLDPSLPRRLKNILGTALLTVALLISTCVPTHTQPPADQAAGTKQEFAVEAPDLAEIIPLAAKLSGRLAAFETRAPRILDVSEVEKKYDVIEANLKGFAAQLQRFKDSKAFRFNRLSELKEEIAQENDTFEEISEPLNQAIRRLGVWREEWLAEKKRSNEWRSSLLEQGALNQVESTFAEADDTIETALNLLLAQLESMLALQEKAGIIHTKINVFTAELDGLLQKPQRGGKDRCQVQVNCC
jgi:hypothetical protein